MLRYLLFSLVLIFNYFLNAQKWCSEGVILSKKGDNMYTVKWTNKNDQIVTQNLTFSKVVDKGADWITKSYAVNGSSNYYQLRFIRMIMTNELLVRVRYYNELSKLLWEKTCTASECN
ncbi:MAG: hypothetical protein RIQ90_1165 [Bacteroidota bacterium]|jgi:hypothetical protein